VVERYRPHPQEPMMRMSTLLGRLMWTLMNSDGDFLGPAYMAAGFGDKRKGEYFTPNCLARLLAAMTINEESCRKADAENVPFTLSEPACGAGAMVIAAAEHIASFGLDPAKVCLVTAVDVDSLCMKMAFLQLSIKGISAICIHGNSLTLEELERAVTASALEQRWSAKPAEAQAHEENLARAPAPAEEAPSEPASACEDPPRGRATAEFAQTDLFDRAHEAGE
jgi:hypothetical protein